MPPHLDLSIGQVDSKLSALPVQEYEFSRVFGPEDDNQRLFSELQEGFLIFMGQKHVVKKVWE